MTHAAARARTTPAPLPIGDHELARVLEVVRASASADLRGHRPGMLARRLAQRIAVAGDATVDGYVARLAADPREAEELLAHLTIKVSSFFRDAHAFAVLRDVVRPALARGSGPLHAWSAGCARGEEPYSLAMVLAGAARPVSVLGSDVDPRALAAARAGRFGRAAIAAVPEDARAAWLEADGEGVRVSSALRGRVRFARHDLASDAPPDGAFELVACRNVLIYFDGPLQRRVLALLLERLAPGGFLWLGESEWPTTDAVERLSVVDRRARLFQLASR